jgi:hypothetical protein
MQNLVGKNMFPVVEGSFSGKEHETVGDGWFGWLK